MGLWLAGMLAATWPAAGQTTGGVRRVMLIGWDGAGRDDVKRLLEQGQLPNLQALVADGTFVPINIAEEETDTKAGWAQILTGYGAHLTGVVSDKRYQPIPKGYTIFERLEQAFGSNAVATVAVVANKEDLDAAPPVKTVISEEIEELNPRKRAAKKPAKAPRKQDGEEVIEDGVRYQLTPGKPLFNAVAALDFWENGLFSDERVGARAVAQLVRFNDRPRCFFFVHFGEIERAGRRSGQGTAAYDEAIVSADAQLGRLVRQLKALGVYSATLVYVTADHGFDREKTTHLQAPFVFLATNDKGVARGGTLVDVAPTILARFGLDLTRIVPPLTGAPLLGEVRAPGE